jgi:hypothetical protein
MLEGENDWIFELPLDFGGTLSNKYKAQIDSLMAFDINTGMEVAQKAYEERNKPKSEEKVVEPVEEEAEEQPADEEAEDEEAELTAEVADEEADDVADEGNSQMPESY